MAQVVPASDRLSLDAQLQLAAAKRATGRVQSRGWRSVALDDQRAARADFRRALKILRDAEDAR